MQRILFCAAGALTALAATAVQSGHGAHAQTIDENTVRGPRDVTALINGLPSGAKAPLPKCTLIALDNETKRKSSLTMAFSGTTPLAYSTGCTWADIQRYEENIARVVRERLGDRGRH